MLSHLEPVEVGHPGRAGEQWQGLAPHPLHVNQHVRLPDSNTKRIAQLFWLLAHAHNQLIISIGWLGKTLSTGTLNS